MDDWSDVYDVQAHRFIAERRRDALTLVLPAQGSRVVAVVPAGARRDVRQDVLFCDGKAVDFHHGKAST